MRVGTSRCDVRGWHRKTTDAAARRPYPTFFGVARARIRMRLMALALQDDSRIAPIPFKRPPFPSLQTNRWIRHHDFVRSHLEHRHIVIDEKAVLNACDGDKRALQLIDGGK